METAVYRLLFDTPALLAGNLREWQRYGQLGQCCLPQGVLEEVKFLCDRAPDPALEPKAREFFRFYPTSGWQVSTERQPHPALTQPDGQTLSKRARQAIAVLECAHALAQNHRDQLVVLVTSSQPLLQQLAKMQQPNLCGLTETALKNWGRTEQVPLPLLQGLARLQTEANNRPTSVNPRPSVATPQRRSPPAMTRPKSTRRSSASQLVSLGLALIAIAAAGLFLLKVTQPQRFDQIWQRLNIE
ncbi:PIN domain-containing protein [Sphaerothrix gracilis]|uniref:PIN domain-containing protein n=1 Tax=Sphaerothrix gracilis TaxID=3151835 RepID=UPI0031FE2B0F